MQFLKLTSGEKLVGVQKGKKLRPKCKVLKFANLSEVRLVFIGTTRAHFHRQANEALKLFYVQFLTFF